jgi:hypothetical protein
MRTRRRRAQALSRRIRRQAAGAAPAPGARLDLARRRFVALPRAHARPQGDALRLLSPHRLSAARRGVISGAMRRATHSVFTLPLVGRVGAKRRGGGRAVTRWRRLAVVTPELKFATYSGPVVCRSGGFSLLRQFREGGPHAEHPNDEQDQRTGANNDGKETEHQDELAPSLGIWSINQVGRLISPSL